MRRFHWTDLSRFPSRESILPSNATIDVSNGITLSYCAIIGVNDI